MEYRGLYIEAVEDCDENEGGYYCKVYSDENMKNEIDHFCIPSDALNDNPDVGFWIELFIDGEFISYVIDGIVPKDRRKSRRNKIKMGGGRN